MILKAKATAILEGRLHVNCADIRRAAPPVLRHRIITNFATNSEGLSTLDIVKKLLVEVKEPDAEAYPASKPPTRKTGINLKQKKQARTPLFVATKFQTFHSLTGK